DQNAVVKNDEGGLLLLSRDFETLGFEGGEQAILPGGQRRRNLPFNRLESFARKRRVLGLCDLDRVQASPHGNLAPARQCNIATQRQRRFARKHITPCSGDDPTVAILGVLRDQLRRVELMENASPFGQIELLAYAECRQEMMAVPPDCLARLANEEIGEMARKKSPGGAVNGGHHFLRRDGAIEERPFAVANIAIATRVRGLAESGEQGLTAATRRFAQGDQGIELALLHPLAVWQCAAIIDLPLAQKNVGVAEQGQRFRRQTIAPRAANLLIIGLDALW